MDEIFGDWLKLKSFTNDFLNECQAWFTSEVKVYEIDSEMCKLMEWP